jgi:hypothetical protein
MMEQQKNYTELNNTSKSKLAQALKSYLETTVNLYLWNNDLNKSYDHAPACNPLLATFDDSIHFNKRSINDKLDYY